jgi:hypothetical protein
MKKLRLGVKSITPLKGKAISLSALYSAIWVGILFIIGGMRLISKLVTHKPIKIQILL